MKIILILSGCICLSSCQLVLTYSSRVPGPIAIEVAITDIEEGVVIFVNYTRDRIFITTNVPSRRKYKVETRYLMDIIDAVNQYNKKLVAGERRIPVYLP